MSSVSEIVTETKSPDGAIVEYSLPEVNDDTDPNPTISCEPQSGSLFPLDSTTVTCTTQDESGNSAIVDFVVTVQDTTPPVIGDVLDNTQEATSPNGAIVEYHLPSVIDTVDQNPTLECIPSSSEQFPLGTTEVTCTTSDSSGNTSNITFDVIVQDTTPPEITSPVDITITANITGGATVDLGLSIVSDLVDANPAIENDVSDVFPLGTTTITWTATDFEENSASDTQMITVQALPIIIDIKPGSDENPINLNGNGELQLLFYLQIPLMQLHLT